MITYLNDDWEEDTWGIWISSGVFPCRGFSAVADDGQPGMVNLYINEDCCVEIDDRMYNCTVLAQLEEIDIPWLRQYMECVRVDDDDDPGEEVSEWLGFPACLAYRGCSVSRLAFVDVAIRRGLGPEGRHPKAGLEDV